ncbi:hypothetical protein ACFLTC_01245 [Chloroflexota bacterium]
MRLLLPVTRHRRGVNTISYRLLGAHVNATLDGLDSALSEWKPPLVVVLDHSEVWHRVKAASPDTVMVGRIHREFEPKFTNPNLDPIRAARDHCEMLLPWAERMGETYTFWQGINEPDIQSSEGMQRYADFDSERVRIMDGYGYRVVVGSFSVGNPSDLAWWKDYVPALEEAWRYDGALALHEYGWPSLDHESPWYLLRHRKLYEGEPEHNWEGLPEYLRNMPLLITECGLDGIIANGGRPRGWQVLHGNRQGPYLRELAWYDAELQNDPYVVGAAIYCCCSKTDPNWGTYNIWPEPARTLARKARPIYRLEKLRELPRTPPQAEPPERPIVEPPRPVVVLPAPAQGGELETELQAGSVEPVPPAPASGADPDIAMGGSESDSGVGSAVPETADGESGAGLPPTQSRTPSQPPSSPGPSPPPPPAPSLPTQDEDAKLKQALQRLDRIIQLLQQEK